MSIQEAYEQLITGQLDYFFVKNGLVCDRNQMWKNKNKILHLMPGSFNPLHPGHTAVFNHVQTFGVNVIHAYELSVYRKGKEFLSYQDILDRISQFDDNDYICITNAARFLEKTGSFESSLHVNFHIGYDTALRLINDDGILGVQGMRASFWVYARASMTFDHLPEKARNMHCSKFHEGPHYDHEATQLSSTQLRNAKK